MRKSHQMGFAEYEDKVTNQLKVEKKREQEYRACQKMLAEIDNQI